jgi:DNA repair protein RadA/Sms
MAAQISRRRVLYVTGEESAEQIRRRADRLGVSNEDLFILSEHDLETVTHSVAAEKPHIIIVDSIQTISSAEAGSVPGTPNQMKLAAYELSEQARVSGATVFFVAHVTKEGAIAGPKLLEHLVDVVLYFEQSNDDTRFLRATKNRLGSIDEVGLFTMGPNGLVQVQNPAGLFLVDRTEEIPSGVAVAPVVEGSRVFLVEVQALTVAAKGGVSRIFSDRIDSRRVGRMTAVLERHAGLPMSDYDVYVNVAGGIQIREVGVELPLALAIYSARTDRRFPAGTVATGEVSLAGEVRPVRGIHRRVRAARDMGYSRCVGPVSVRANEEAVATDHHGERWTKADTISGAIRAVFGGE